MKLELKGQKVLVTGGLRDVGRTISEALAAGQVDVVIWIRG
jgi:NAD(P)-dependent dehydrogenase (short-subunit alcohol dehydrogenase family)